MCISRTRFSVTSRIRSSTFARRLGGPPRLAFGRFTSGGCETGRLSPAKSWRSGSNSPYTLCASRRQRRSGKGESHATTACPCRARALRVRAPQWVPCEPSSRTRSTGAPVSDRLTCHKSSPRYDLTGIAHTTSGIGARTRIRAERATCGWWCRGRATRGLQHRSLRPNLRQWVEARQRRSALDLLGGRRHRFPMPTFVVTSMADNAHRKTRCGSRS